MFRVAAGDMAALAELFDRHKARLYGFLARLTGDHSLAEDLVGEAFLRVYQARSSFRGGSDFPAWLFTIARNLAIGEMRRRGTRQRAEQRLCRELAERADARIPEDGRTEWVQQALFFR